MTFFKVDTTPERNTIIVGVSFFLVFAGWTASSSFATTKNGDIGAQSIGIVYLVFTLSNFIASPIIKKFSPKIVMFFSGLTYCLYISSNIILNPLSFEYDKYLLYLCSIFIGFGACCIWISQSMFITQCSNIYEVKYLKIEKNTKLGYFNGIFYMFFLFNRLTGYLVSAILFQLQYDTPFVFTILSIISLTGCCGFFAIQSMQSIEDEQKKNIPIIKSQSSTNTFALIQKSFYSTINLWKSFNLLCLITFTMFTGVDMQFNAGVYPLLIHDKSTKFYLLSFFGFICSISSLIFGKLSDKKLTRLQILFIGGFSKLIYYLYLYLNQKQISLIYYNNTNDIDNDNDTNILYNLILCALLMGIGDGCLLTQLSAIYPILLGKSPEVFANIKLWQSGSTAIVFFLHSSLTLELKIKINLALLIIGYVPFVCFSSIRSTLSQTK